MRLHSGGVRVELVAFVEEQFRLLEHKQLGSSSEKTVAAPTRAKRGRK